jgi:hypothetical protein
MPTRYSFQKVIDYMLMKAIFLLLAVRPVFGWADVQGAPRGGTLLDDTGKPARGVVYVRRVPLPGESTIAPQRFNASLFRTNELGDFRMEKLSVGRYSLCVTMDDPALLSHCDAFPPLTFDVGAKVELPIRPRAIRGVQVQFVITDKTGALAIGKKLGVGVAGRGSYFRRAAVSDRRHGYVSLRANIPRGPLPYFVFFDLDPAIVLRDDKGTVWSGQGTRMSIETSRGDQVFRFDVGWSGKGIGVD